MFTAYILRHAHKEFGGYYNPLLRHQDEPISVKGQTQAEQLADYFADKSISALFISQYLRTAQTIAPTASRLGFTPTVDARLNEVDNGVIEGKNDEEIQRAYPDVWQAYRRRDSDFRFPEGETGEEAMHRAAAFLEEKQERMPSGTIIAVCHDALVRVLMCYLLGLPVYKRWNFRVDFCGITEVTYQPEYASWKLLRYNHTLS